MGWAKATARQDEKHLSFEIYNANIRGFTVYLLQTLTYTIKQHVSTCHENFIKYCAVSIDKKNGSEKSPWIQTKTGPVDAFIDLDEFHDDVLSLSQSKTVASPVEIL